ncbi:asparagine synthase (glutamine-hydrolyzing) [Gemmatimonas groenlandica]|uniref:asparagine synthase (glutamine-hydrolyzing) n=1 Tax=Gemmatimonas groenlandica TaxID=2732249 RepID=A0A6M4IS12_9BACT|nr:asparagine synthase (glutamine-hydrolyzing) [Gemmatimonas groenlandica]QJR36226.1 asparagine synthase (glutamine-hydrolyzing) [Gemmatimonas groenlandica]
MCGINGTIRFRGTVDRELLGRQRDTMEHRGPDSSGIWFSNDGRVGFGHRRLAIIDLSPGGHQPMIDGETGTVITFNGEIYNYVELRDRLRAKGHVFRTHSDTEVILAAYREWGTDCVAQLGGMFAFALYDESKQRVMLARDRAGEKPLFYRVNDEQFTFASEAKALLADPTCPRRVRAQSLNEYLAYGYVTGENTMFADIRRVAPAGRVVINLATGAIAHDSYWTLPQTALSASSADPEALVEELHELLKASVRRQLMADVPIGVLLSGGVDSSIVTAIAAEVSGSRIRTFTARFPGHGGFDEGPYARMVADHLGTEHIELEAKAADASLLQSLVAQFDDPISDSSMIPTFLVSQEIRKHATVAIGGDGGDELFGGYHRYPVQIQAEQLRARVPRGIRQIAAYSAEMILPVGTPGRGFAKSLAGTSGDGLANAGRIFRADERLQLTDALRSLDPNDILAPEILRSHAFEDRESALQRATALDFSSYMVDDVLVKVDRASMMSSLEVRAPLLDVDVIEFAFSRVPDSLKADRMNRKLILRRLGQRLLPKRLDLTRKQGFSIPIDAWMKHEWRDQLDGAQAQAQGLISPKAFETYRGRLDAGLPIGERLYSLLFIQLWSERFAVTDVI